MTIESTIGKEASREIVEPGKMNFAFRMIDGGKSRLLLRPQRAGRFYRSRDIWCPSPAPRGNRRWERAMYWDTRAQAARAANLKGIPG